MIKNHRVHCCSTSIHPPETAHWSDLRSQSRNQWITTSVCVLLVLERRLCSCNITEVLTSCFEAFWYFRNIHITLFYNMGPLTVSICMQIDNNTIHVSKSDGGSWSWPSTGHCQMWQEGLNQLLRLTVTVAVDESLTVKMSSCVSTEILLNFFNCFRWQAGICSTAPFMQPLHMALDNNIHRISYPGSDVSMWNKEHTDTFSKSCGSFSGDGQDTVVIETRHSCTTRTRALMKKSQSSTFFLLFAS